MHMHMHMYRNGGAAIIHRGPQIGVGTPPARDEWMDVRGNGDVSEKRQVCGVVGSLSHPLYLRRQ